MHNFITGEKWVNGWQVQGYQFPKQYEWCKQGRISKHLSKHILICPCHGTAPQNVSGHSSDNWMTNIRWCINSSSGSNRLMGDIFKWHIVTSCRNNYKWQQKALLVKYIELHQFTSLTKSYFNIQFIEASCISEKQFDWTWFKPLLSTRSVCRISKLYNVMKHVTVPGRNTLKPTRRHVKQSTYERWKLHQAAQRWFVLCKKSQIISLICTCIQNAQGSNISQYLDSLRSYDA